MPRHFRAHSEEAVSWGSSACACTTGILACVFLLNERPRNTGKNACGTFGSTVVLVQNVSKLYRLYQRPADRIREILPFFPNSLHTEFWALRDISFSLQRGEVLGLVGPNGCGKSTLLQIVCGILPPSSGRVVTQGRIAALLELGAGFN